MDRLRADLGSHREHLWGLCYRMTGSAADADDLVQETFRRALETPPADLDRDLRPWLVRVAVNLSRDALRARKRRGYDGTWLPSPVATPAEDTAERLPAKGADAESRYSQLQSVTLAFLIALEELTPRQRAVLLLRDVFDYSARETADALQLSEANVKTTLHRARHVMSEYAARAQPPSHLRQQHTRAALQALCIHLMTHNVPALEALLAEDVRARNDGGGEFFAARKPVVGRAKVIMFHLNTATGGVGMRAEIQMLNGMPALVAERAPDKPRVATRMVIQVELDEQGKICEVDTIVATAKLSAIDWAALPDAKVGIVAALGAALHNPPWQLWARAAATQLAQTGLARATAWWKLRRRARARARAGGQSR